ncbi:TPA: hypothetical protein N0F65_002651 [Lagenidium giganteum]|uniref:RNase H type-1 domain-containing protein n=1 Tax=Lagenidium giganteum TaxID=4803 RepID=A0AAV2Z3T6_9STRA|nr:TPA: hypothetical protein N0F65_002651 [Lagenidium giganteum]
MPNFELSATELHEVRRRQLQQITIVGDSKLIIAPLKTQRWPKALHLQQLHDQVSDHLDHIPGVHWVHHLRTYNKMCDTRRTGRWTAFSPPPSPHTTQRRYTGKSPVLCMPISSIRQLNATEPHIERRPGIMAKPKFHAC